MARTATSRPTPRRCCIGSNCGATRRRACSFIPHKIDDNSGVGTQVIAKDLNGDGVPDIIVGNKKGVFVFLSQPAK